MEVVEVGNILGGRPGAALSGDVAEVRAVAGLMAKNQGVAVVPVQLLQKVHDLLDENYTTARALLRAHGARLETAAKCGECGAKNYSCDCVPF
jgi:hypothetical protein